MPKIYDATKESSKSTKPAAGEVFFNIKIKPLEFIFDIKLPEIKPLEFILDIKLPDIQYTPKQDRPCCVVTQEPNDTHVYPRLKINIDNLMSKPPFHPGEPGKNNGFVFFKPGMSVQTMPAVDPKENTTAP